jgi:geranylgeranyl reductase family protein
LERQALKTGITVVGAGPAGVAASLRLSEHGISHVLLDAHDFPRDKICGDAISGKVISALNKINPKYKQNFLNHFEQKAKCWGISFLAPNKKRLDIPFKWHVDKGVHSPGYISERSHFDNWCFEQVNRDFASVLTRCKVKSFLSDEDAVRLETSKGTIKTSLVIDASGAHSIFNKSFGHEMDKKHYSAGLRQYFQGVQGLHEENYIELHFNKNFLPGYFWIFPLPEDKANVGVGMLSKAVSKKKINLKKSMANLINEDQDLRERFSAAKALESPKGWGLPMGSKKRCISGQRILLTGDAASLIDPFTGEGIGNAMHSGILAADKVQECLQRNKFTDTELRKYDHAVYQKLWPELKMSYTLQKMLAFPFLFNYVVNKGRKSESFRKLLTAMFDDVDLRKQFRNPLFYLKLLFNQ